VNDDQIHNRISSSPRNTSSTRSNRNGRRARAAGCPLNCTASTTPRLWSGSKDLEADPVIRALSAGGTGRQIEAVWLERKPSQLTACICTHSLIIGRTVNNRRFLSSVG
jgi:hypothetical protein